ncbi:nucleotidyltransferase family protein [Alkaliphilus hydrothermalis]|uniref:GTP:adenosylcobinamide-phosphate guanylyltransferase n=1 Tax=Alkaliphilus hydrothermalis TaxID=1482730 RepID=A0ABS2NQF6_9FIRM|nr:nucleotidyltransferase family protein [Alkaliphilus hydrothermalis]MBM7615032.1 GTP:adenosylcobinamide-phosphate guanylyltransferase [Alkaliphilus hydrothermalis]
MHAVILAGGNQGKSSNTFGSIKALCDFKGIPMIKYVINALRESGHIDKIMVIGDQGKLKKIIGDDADVLTQEEESMIDNLIVATNYFANEDRLLVSTCDIPLLKGEMIADFIEAGLKENKELIYPIVERNICEGAFPDVKRTFVTLKEGAFTGGNLVLLDPKAMGKIEAISRMMVENRKNPVKMSRLLGWKFLLLLLLKRLTIEDIENHIEKTFNIKAKAMINLNPEVGNDVDRLEDVAILEKYL